MATPPNPTDGNPQNPVPETVKPMDNDKEDANKGAAKEPSIFVNKEPVREDQVQNAVKFLSHPKVKGSPVVYRRSFLEKKGLTKEEIDEAFRRVPDDSPSLSTTQPVVANQGSQSQAASNIQPQVATQPLQPALAAPAAPESKYGSLTGSRFHWSHAILAVGVLAISGAGTAVVFKNAVVPRLKSWIRKVVDEDGEDDVANKTNKKPTLAEEAAAAAKAAAAAASDVALASQEMLVSKTEEKKYFGELLSLLDVQVREMKSMSNSIRKLEDQTNNSGREVQVTSTRPPYTNGRPEYDLRSARSMSPPPASVEPSATPPHPKSYMEIMSMIQRGERPPNIREINDLPPNPDQPVSNPRLAPKPKPWEAAQSQSSSAYPPYENSNGVNYHAQDNGSGPASVYHSNGEGAAPWWQQKNAQVNEVEPEENKIGYSGQTSERPIQRSSWVPPQPPPVAMAEAAAAIRQPKKSTYEKEQQLTDDQFLARSAEITDELQRVTKISESGGVSPDFGAESSVTTNTSEIQREEESSYYEA
ncbi:peroxisomal membrane protein PEX14-like [Rutidosis leptorrhynchoides]|uniref:peroxisomal membrane protein PEX14-like n=1 Tax=Rutidosis leptorrhynchoides TaxID=125765 RepID=UPI003A996A4C